MAEMRNRVSELPNDAALAASRLDGGLSMIDSLANSKPTWAGREVEPPAQQAIETAKDAYRRIFTGGFITDRIVASGEGGVALCFLRGDAYADMEFLNDGELLACTLDRTSGATEVWEFSLEMISVTADRIKDFLARHAARSL